MGSRFAATFTANALSGPWCHLRILAYLVTKKEVLHTLRPSPNPCQYQNAFSLYRGVLILYQGPDFIFVYECTW